jgi:GNAT superfamily N-acetyltransferase
MRSGNPRPIAARDEGTRQRRAGTLPDAPRWLETRAMLLSGRGRLVGRGGDAGGYGVDDSVVRLLSLVGRPAAAVVREGLALRPSAVLVQEEDDAGLRPLLAGFRREIAILHRLPVSVELRPLAGAPSCRLLSAGATAWLGRWPEAQRREFAAALALGLPMAGALVGEEVAAVCYGCYETETLWDISIDTREEHRRRGLAAAAVRFLAAHQASRGLEPAWGAVETNRPSLTMAASLGFRPVERFVVYEPEGSTWSGPQAAGASET